MKTEHKIASGIIVIGGLGTIIVLLSRKKQPPADQNNPPPDSGFTPPDVTTILANQILKDLFSGMLMNRQLAYAPELTFDVVSPAVLQTQGNVSLTNLGSPYYQKQGYFCSRVVNPENAAYVLGAVPNTAIAYLNGDRVLYFDGAWNFGWWYPTYN